MIVKILTHIHMVVYTWWCWHICKGEEVELFWINSMKKRRWKEVSRSDQTLLSAVTGCWLASPAMCSREGAALDSSIGRWRGKKTGRVGAASDHIDVHWHWLVHLSREDLTPCGVRSMSIWCVRSRKSGSRSSLEVTGLMVTERPVIGRRIKSRARWRGRTSERTQGDCV
jgi:hypothetical protein